MSRGLGDVGGQQPAGRVVGPEVEREPQHQHGQHAGVLLVQRGGEHQVDFRQSVGGAMDHPLTDRRLQRRQCDRDLGIEVGTGLQRLRRFGGMALARLPACHQPGEFKRRWPILGLGNTVQPPRLGRAASQVGDEGAMQGVDETGALTLDERMQRRQRGVGVSRSLLRPGHQQRL